MYYVPEGTERCGFYECAACGTRFLDVKVLPRIVCPYCGEQPDMELAPGEEMPEVADFIKEFLPHYGSTLDELLRER